MAFFYPQGHCQRMRVAQVVMEELEVVAAFGLGEVVEFGDDALK